MNIREIAGKLNKLASTVSPFNNLQNIHAKNKGLDRPRTYNIFSASTIFDDDEYAFHDGGRNEIQFNIGVEYLNNKEIFRYGLAFSLGANQSQPDPILYFTPKINAFNNYLKTTKDPLDDLFMWDYTVIEEHRKRSQDRRVTTIPANWITQDNFIFIGKYFIKSIDKINDADLSEIISLFNRLMPVYEYVEGNYKQNEKRITRICWNKYGWVRPSGRIGKSTNKDTHENKHGYGHEEWLGDVSKTIDGYHYSFLEAIGKSVDTFAGNCYDVDLFTINSENGNRYLIGAINNLEVINAAIAATVKKRYEKEGWLVEMEDQIKAVNEKSLGFSHWNGLDIFNVRFRPEDLHFYSDYLLTHDEGITNLKRYTFAHKEREFITDVPKDKPFKFTAEDGSDKDYQADALETSHYTREGKPIEITYLHKQIRDCLFQYFKEKGEKQIKRELPTGKGASIDFARREKGRTIFYEIKTYNSLKACFREAIGQILEYAYWPNEENADELIIVSQNKINDEGKAYLQKLRVKYKLPIYYQQFDVGKKELSEKY